MFVDLSFVKRVYFTPVLNPETPVFLQNDNDVILIVDPIRVSVLPVRSKYVIRIQLPDGTRL